jgi:hypothetical protein
MSGRTAPGIAAILLSGRIAARRARPTTRPSPPASTGTLPHAAPAARPRPGRRLARPRLHA